MDDGATVDLEEFKQLRAEIVNRTTLGHQLASYALTALAAGFAIAEKYPDSLLGLTALISALWLLWIDNTSQVFKVAGYIGLRLAPRLRRSVQHDTALGWEGFLREINAGGLTANKALYGEGPVRVPLARTGSTGSYMTIVFIGSSIALMATYCLGQSLLSPAINLQYTARLVAIVTVVAILVFSGYRARQLVRGMRGIDEAILAAERPQTLP